MFRLIAATALLALLPFLSWAADEPKAVVSVDNKSIEASIVIDPALKVYPGLYDRLLADGKREYNKAVAPDAAKLTLNSDLRIPSLEVLKPGATARTAVDGSVAQAKVEAPVAARVAASYTIQKGDTPYAIARKQGVKVAELLKFNGIKDPSALKPGQSLKIPTKG